MQPHKALYPFGMLYGLGVRFRNALYDAGWLSSYTPPVYTVCVGNISAGGTGKTPMVEYLTALAIAQGTQVAVLSRGYKRKSKGFLQVRPGTGVAAAGDELCQIARKFPMARIFACADRVEGVKKILELYPRTGLILLDDAFQHRKISAHLNILLTRYDALYTDDYYLPAGYLRDHRVRVRQAGVVVVTKCPDTLSEAEKGRIREKLKLHPRQHLFFAGTGYGEPRRLTGERADPGKRALLAVTGIAGPAGFVDRVSKTFNLKKHLTYPDHYDFKPRDIEKWKAILSDWGGGAVITTEKDAVRLTAPGPGIAGMDVFYIPVKLKLPGVENEFNRLVLKGG